MTQCARQPCRREAEESMILKFNGQWFHFCSEHFYVLRSTLDDHLRAMRKALGK